MALRRVVDFLCVLPFYYCVDGNDDIQTLDQKPEVQSLHVQKE